MSSSTGELLKTDTSKVIIPVKYLRDANAKMIELVYVKKINNEQDSIIRLNKMYIGEQEVIIKDFQERVVGLTYDNNKLRNDVFKQKNKTKFLLVTTIASIAVTLITVFGK